MLGRSSCCVCNQPAARYRLGQRVPPPCHFSGHQPVLHSFARVGASKKGKTCASTFATISAGARSSVNGHHLSLRSSRRPPILTPMVQLGCSISLGGSRPQTNV